MATITKRELYTDAQRRVVGSLLADSSHISRVLELITEEDFEEPSYALTFEAVAELSRLSQPISALTAADALERMGKLKEAGNPLGLYTLATEGERYLQEAPVEVYARIVKEASAKAKISRTLQEAGKSFQDDSGVQAVDAVSELQAFLNSQLLHLSDASTISRFNEGFQEYLDLLDNRKKVSEENALAAEGLQGIPSLLPTLNKLTTGWVAGQMITVGARTGVGKTIFAINCAVAAAKANHSVLFFSLEMSRHELEDRFMASMTGIPMNKLKQGDLTEEERKRLLVEMEEMASMKLILDVEPKLTVDGIKARALKQAQSQEGLDFIIIDYLQLLTPAGRFSSRQEAVADISRNVKLLAKQLGVPVLVLVQVQREKDDDENAMPQLHQIRESGAMGQDSDVVILIHRDKTQDDTTPLTMVILAKNRNGPDQRIIRCHSNLSCSLFREVTRVKDIEQLAEDDLDDLSEDLDLEDFTSEDLDDFDASDLDF